MGGCVFLRGVEGDEWANSSKCVVDCEWEGGRDVGPGDKNLQVLDL